MEDRLHTKPVFSGTSTDLDRFVTGILNDLSLGELAYYAGQKYAAKPVVTEAGYTLPEAVQGGIDATAGVETDFPMPLHIGNSWDIKLAQKIGTVMGNERRGELEAVNPNTLIYSGNADLRPNALNGRYYEGYSEDPVLSGEMAAATGLGVAGDDPFYIKTQVGTKHFNVHYSEWDRRYVSKFVSARSMYEYYAKAFIKSFREGRMHGVMTAYGGVNGIPSAISPFLKLLEEYSGYHLFNVSDFNGDGNLLLGNGNGYDKTYATSAAQVAALLLKAKSYSNNHVESTVTPEDFVKAVENKLLGVDICDLREYVRPQIELWVRSGYFNLEDYPYASIAADGTPAEASCAQHQEIALEAAQDGIVLLKNENQVLPLSGTDSVVVTGMFADSKVKPKYSIASPDGVDLAGLTFLEGLRIIQPDAEKLSYAPELSGKRVILQDKASGKYWMKGSSNNVYAGADDKAAAAKFQVYDWGQDSFSFCDEQAQYFLGIEGGAAVMSPRDKAATPPCFTYEPAGDTDKYIRYGAIITDPAARVRSDLPYYKFYTTQGNFLQVDQETSAVVLGEAVTSGYERAPRYTETVIRRAGEGIESYTGKCNKALVFIGADPFIFASESTDRPRLAIGQDQINLVNKVADTFPGNTIVVVNSCYVIGIDEIKNNPDVAGIVFTSYGGQFEGMGLANILYGRKAPSGRLSFSWLKDLSSYPQLDENAGVDPRYTVEMQNADPAQTGMTYLYNNDSDLTYEFGYGLAYTEFRYDNFSYSLGEDHLEFTVDITNTGNIASSEVIQVYARSIESAYRTYVPKMQLAGFEKAACIKPGETRSVTVTVEKDSMSLWDVVANRFIFEAGRYEFMIGKSSKDILWRKTVAIEGDTIGTLDLAEKINVWSHAYGSCGTTAAEVSKHRTSEFAGNYYAVKSNAALSYVILPNVKFDGLSKLTIGVGLAEGEGSIAIYAGERTGEALCSFLIRPTGVHRYLLDGNSDLPVTELAYTEQTADILLKQSGTRDMYIVFHGTGLCIDYITAR